MPMSIQVSSLLMKVEMIAADSTSSVCLGSRPVPFVTILAASRSIPFKDLVQSCTALIANKLQQAQEITYRYCESSRLPSAGMLAVTEQAMLSYERYQQYQAACGAWVEQAPDYLHP